MTGLGKCIATKTDSLRSAEVLFRVLVGLVEAGNILKY